VRGTAANVVSVDLKLEDEDGLNVLACEIAHPWEDPIGAVRAVWFQLDGLALRA